MFTHNAVGYGNFIYLFILFKIIVTVTVTRIKSKQHI